MTLVTPSGFSNFDWSPKNEGLTKTASTGETAKSDKDLLYEAAFKFVKAQEDKKEEKKEDKGEEKSEKKEDKGEEKSEKSENPFKKGDDKDDDKGEEKSEGGDDKPCDTPPCDDGKVNSDPAADIQKAVGELVEKSNKADETAQKVQEAVTQLDEAVQQVKEVAGVAEAAVEGIEGAEGEVPGVVGDMPSVDEVEIEIGGPDDAPSSDFNEVSAPSSDMGSPMGSPSGMGSGMGNELLGDGVEKESTMGLTADANSYVKLSSVSKETAKKVTTFWKDYLGYPEDYVKLMVKNYEK